ncbi:glutamate decarboxylase-like protein 1 [Patellaria atrata CBS 101060]|uniref:Glutamate decarboxylase-like protein 1 n=1 Tax=Patellaria atrata CBS 101060 TaxID=1346257 RepID=A0A9P4S9L7_9PEZI|nr:glutamate decarboxylase-like protein 1 [Patellaria atrata CBS 101060]
MNRADEVERLINSVLSLIVPFIRAADEDADSKPEGHGLQVPSGGPRTTLVESHPPKKLQSLLGLQDGGIDGLGVTNEGQGKEGVLKAVEKILGYSVNTWDQGFMDKLYGSTNAVGLASELLLATLNTNAHVYSVSPALTLIEKHTTRALARLFGLTGPHAGGISQPGGSASNQTSIIVARNTLFPSTKRGGLQGRRFTLFTSTHGHYSVEKAAQMFGFGADAVIAVPVDSAGKMDATQLETLVLSSQEKGETPFYVNATAGTTVLGSFDPIDAIADICHRHNLWLHIDGSWGGPIAFSPSLSATRLASVHRADSIAVTPHKMLGVPLTCSFLLGRDVRLFHKSYTLPAGYLFHGADDEGVGPEENVGAEVWDLADLTPQCGRRAESLKLHLAWLYYGAEGFRAYVEAAHAAATCLFDHLSKSNNIVLVSAKPLPCMQVCFHYARNGEVDDKERNDRVTKVMARELLRRGWMVDFAPGERGLFFRVVVNGGTRRGTVEGLVRAVEEVGGRVWESVGA